jgi:hypothetical protein
MPPVPEVDPHRDHVVAYLAAYEERYRLPLRRPVRVQAIERGGDGHLLLRTVNRDWSAARAAVQRIKAGQ